MSRNVVVLGCGRSGTSILGELFAHLGYTYWSEPDVSKIMSQEGINKLAVKVPRSSPGWAADHGLSIPMQDLLAKMDNPLVYWIVRHPLDCICSLRVGISRNWGHHPRPPDWQNWLDRSWIEQCAHHWCFVNGAGYQRIRAKARLIYFENLVLDAMKCAAHVCSDLSMEESIGQCQSWVDQVQNANNHQFVEAKTSRPYSTKDHSKRVGRWQENMTPLEAGLAWSLVSTIAQKFGYQQSTSIPQPNS